MYIRKILLAVLLIGLLLCSAFAYMVYDTFFSPNTKFTEEIAYVYIPSDAKFPDLKELIAPLVEDTESFVTVADKKKYTSNVKGGKYALRKGMNNNAIVNVLRSANIPVQVSFNNQESLAGLAGRVASQIEADSIALLQVFRDSAYLAEYGFSPQNALSLYLPNSYEFFWDTDATEFRDRMLREYQRFWNEARLEKAGKLGLSPLQVSALAAIVHKETAKIEERPRVAGLYLNRLKHHMPLQADPTVIYALKRQLGNYDTVIRRVLYSDLRLDSPYNTYKYPGIPPGPITMPDITALDAVLNAEKHDYYYMVADVENFGYHKFASTLMQHNRNKAQYVRWINSQNINR